MTGTMPDGSANLASWTRLLRAAACRDGVDRMRRDAERAAAQIAPGSLWRGTCLSILAAAYLLAGDDRRADAVFADAYEAAQVSGAVEAASIALAERSLVAIARGAWREAEGLAHRARDMVREAELDDYATSSIVYAASGRAALRQSDWVRAHDDIDRSERLLPLLTHALPWLAVQVRLELVRLHLALTDTARARELMAEVDELLVRRPDLGVLADEAAELRARLDTDRPSADGWASTLTAAELRLLPLLATHLSFRQIADRLRVSRNTVKTQAISVYRKLGVSSRSDAIDRAVELGLVGVDLGLPAPADPVAAS
jgi:LuxR family transcriptional regulator, maltose regulon positive regulatory protein